MRWLAALSLVLLLLVSSRGDSRATLRRLFDHYAGGQKHISAAGLAARLPADLGATAARVRRDVLPPHDASGDGRWSWDEFAAAFPVASSARQTRLKQGHLSLGDGGNSMWIMWVSPDNASLPWVQWGSAADVLNRNASGTSHTYFYEDGTLDSFHQHIFQVEMTGLSTPGEYVYYRYGFAKDNDWSNVFRFRMPGVQSAKFVVLADQGTIEPLGSAVAKQIANYCSARDCDAVHICGDLSYAWHSAVPGPEEQWVWDLYQAEQTVYAQTVPQMTTIGNHEKYRNATAFNNRYRMPGTESGGGNFYFSYRLGPVHIIAFSTDGPPSDAQGSAQFQWLERDLASVDRSQTPWVVFTTHRPVFCSSKDEFSQHKLEEELLEPIFLKYKVDLVLTGHMHVYERIYPNKGGVPVVPFGSSVYMNPGAPAYVVQGTGGCLLSLPEVWRDPQPAWSAKRAMHYGMAVVDANATHLQYQFVLEKDNSVFDCFWIVKP